MQLDLQESHVFAQVYFYSIVVNTIDETSKSILYTC